MWLARGVDAAAPGIRVRCLDDAGTRILDEAEDGAGARVRRSHLACPESALLAFSVTQRAAVAHYVALVLIDDQGRATVLHAPPDAAPFDRGSIDVSLDRALPLRGRSAFSVYAIFTPERRSSQGLEEVIARAARDGVDLLRLARFPVEGSLQARVDVTVSSEAHAR
jgi:hypothetical protein